jgi:hypothetical protein
MKTHFKNTGLLLLGVICMTSCSNNDDVSQPIVKLPPSGQAFQNLRAVALQNQTQSFTATAGAGTISLTSAKGVTITLNGNALTKNGNPVTGSIDIKFVELFDKGSMLATNKPTMGVMPNGDKGLLISGGEFYINATQGGVQLVSTAPMQLNVPVNLSGDPIDNNMILWAGDTTDEDNLAWKRDGGTPVVGGQGGAVGFTFNSYTATFGNFGWTNIDRFYNDPRPKTQILASVPAGYNNTNSSIYLSVDGEGQNQLAKFDTYNPTTLQFSEHYGQIPIGLVCHLIFASTENGQWRYGVKAVTTTANAVYNFDLSETVLGTEAQMIAAINAIQ